MIDVDGVACGEHTRIAAALATDGWVAIPDYLDTTTLADWRAAAEALRQTPDFRPARIGRGDERVLRPDIRTDRICWLDPDVAEPLAGWFRAMDDLRAAINRELYMGLWDYESHLAVFPPGAFYRRHLDQFAGGMDRLVSTVLYLNRDWPSMGGGELRLFLPDGAGGERILDLAPLGGTLVVFLSAEIEHEVRPALNARYSLTGWFRRRSL